MEMKPSPGVLPSSASLRFASLSVARRSASSRSESISRRPSVPLHRNRSDSSRPESWRSRQIPPTWNSSPRAARRRGCSSLGTGCPDVERSSKRSSSAAMSLGLMPSSAIAAGDAARTAPFALTRSAGHGRVASSLGSMTAVRSGWRWPAHYIRAALPNEPHSRDLAKSGCGFRKIRRLP